MTGMTKRRHRYLPLLLVLLVASIVFRWVAGVLGVWIPVSALTAVGIIIAVFVLVSLLVISVRQLDLRKARPILMKEMRSRMRGTRTPLLLLLASGAAVIVALLIIAPGWEYAGGPEGMSDRLAEIGQTLFVGVSLITAVIVALVTPAIASGVVAHEYETQTFDFLLITPLSEAGILSGKLLAALSFAAMLVLCTLPVTALAFFFGGVAPWLLFAAPLFILFGAYCLGAISLYCSARFRKVAVATAVAYVLCLALLITQPLLEAFSYDVWDILQVIAAGVGGLVLFALLIIGILAGTSALIKRERGQRFFLLKRVTAILLSVLVLDVILTVLCGGLDSVIDTDYLNYANAAFSLMLLLNEDPLYYYSLDEAWPMVLVSLGCLLLLAQFSFRKARYILRCQRVQPPKPDGPRLRFRVKPW
ncbi:MAG: ABC transporter permease [Armatimonadota bacterium]